MERTQLFDLMGELKLYGMKAAFDEIMATAIKRQHEPQRIVGDLLNADEVTPSTSPEVKPNAETWLDFTDLVFIDPVGTGYSRFAATGEDVRKQFFSVDGDVNALALVIRRWLEKHDRLLSPKYVAGESYGGIRGPKVVRQLQMQQGVGVKGLIMISPVFDYRESGTSLLQYVATLPSYVATVRGAKGPVKRTDLADVEAYARGEFLTDLVKGKVDKEATTRLPDKVATLTGIDQTVSRRLGGRFGITEFSRELDRNNGEVAGLYETPPCVASNPIRISVAPDLAIPRARRVGRR